jgi:tetratricopeptide (TPR) repeat protein
MAKTKLKINKRAVLLTSGVVVLLLAAAAVGFGVQWWQRSHQPAQKPTPLTVGDQVQNLRISGNADAATKKIQESLNSPATSSNDKYELLIQLGNVAFDKRDYQAAVDSYAKAAAIKDTYAMARSQADTWALIGDKAKAIEFYKKTISLLKPDDPLRDDDQHLLEQKIRDLGGQP